ncbi:MAG: PP2C family protein-serine/threonine phosphatase [Gemmataceae bacterium]
MEPYPTPQSLVEALHARQGRARRQLQDLLREPVERLIGQLMARHGLDADRELLVQNALHLAEVLLRVRPASGLAGVSWGAFRGSLLLRLAQLAVEPANALDVNGRDGPTPLPDCPVYHSETFFRPYGRVGGRHVGGDWYAGRRLDDGTLWVFLADVTGHGYYAYLLATALPAVWQRLWESHPGLAPEPAELLAAMHELLADCLPDGVFLECTLVRLTADGRATVAPCGGTRLLVHPSRRPPDVVKLRGAWLGLRAPTLAEQHSLVLGHGDELVLATDGVFDQLDDSGGAEAVTRRVPQRRGALFAALREAVEASLASGEQKDDLTMVLLRRRDRGEVAILPFPGAGGEVDVSV